MITGYNHDQEELEYLMHFDTITELPNQLLLRELFDQAKAGLATRSSGLETPLLPLFYLKLDEFNESQGENISRRWLKTIARRLLKNMPALSSLARVAADEFVLIPKPCFLPGKVVELADQTLKIISEPFSLKSNTSMTASLGIALYPCDGPDLDTLIIKARSALAQAKLAGGNDYRLYTYPVPARSQVEKVAATVIFTPSRIAKASPITGLMPKLAELLSALNENRLEVYYQPQFDLLHGELIGAEAFLYWPHPQYGLVLVDKLLSQIVSRSDRITYFHHKLKQFEAQLQEWFVKTVCTQIRVWQQSQLLELGAGSGKAGTNVKRRIALKLPSFSFEPGSFDLVRHPNSRMNSGFYNPYSSRPKKRINQLYSRLDDLFTQGGLNSEYVVLEVDEATVLQTEPTTIKRILFELKTSGIHLSLINFGSSRCYSGLTYLEWYGFEFDSLALAPGLVRACGRPVFTSESWTSYYLNMAKASIGLAHYEGLVVIAQGVDAKAGNDFLNSYGCDIGQGQFYSPSLQVKDFSKLLARTNPSFAKTRQKWEGFCKTNIYGSLPQKMK